MVSKKQRQRQLARQKWQRQQNRRVEHARKSRRREIIGAAVVGVLLVGALVTWGALQLFHGSPTAASQPEDTPSHTPSPSASISTLPTATPKPSATDAAGAPAPSPTAPGECRYVTVAGSDQKSVGRPPTRPGSTLPTTATVHTDHGAFVVTLDPKAAPCAVNSLRFLADKRVYDHTTCDQMAQAPAKARYLQCGDLTGSGASGPGYVFANEHGQRTVPAGRVVMADGADRNGSRFMVTYERSTFDRPVTVIGTVSSGLDVVRKAVDSGITASAGGDAEQAAAKGVGRPKTTIVVDDVEVGPHG